jgi:thymidylate synthase
VPLSPHSYKTIAEAYRAVVDGVLTDGQDVQAVTSPDSIGSGFGTRRRPFRELMGVAFAVERPMECLLGSAVRGMNLEYALAQWAWTMAGSDDVAAISYYNSKGWSFSDDGHSLKGAFGYRLRRAEGIDQLERIVARLRTDAASRREVAVVSLPVDLRGSLRDQPCLISLQFLLRNDALNLIVMMRSQSACLVLPYDASLFMMLQCWMASRLSLAVGSYVHFAGSLHIYEDECDLARSVLDGGLSALSLGGMPDACAQTDELIEFEAKLRSAVLALDEGQLRRLTATLSHPNAGDFFSNAKRVFAVGAATRLRCSELAYVLMGELPTAWQRLLRETTSKGYRVVSRS